MGIGTAMVYPTCLSGIAGHAHPAQRTQVLGVYRFWRDFGYVIGALSTGIIADLFGVSVALQVVAFLTLTSGIYVVYSKKRWGLEL
jgi:MFS family permease